MNILLRTRQRVNFNLCIEDVGEVTKTARDVLSAVCKVPDHNPMLHSGMASRVRGISMTDSGKDPVGMDMRDRC